MTFSQLHERLRLEIWRRIQRGMVTGKLLAAQTGLRPSHISNFLHRKRKLSLNALDKLLLAQQITIHELVGWCTDTDEMEANTTAESLRIPVIAQSTALSSPLVPRNAVQSYISLPTTEFDRLPPGLSSTHRSWERFVGIRLTAEQAAAMTPLLRERSILVIDRHDNALKRPPSHPPKLYAVRLGARLLLRYVTFDSKRLVLRPYRLDFPVEILEISSYDSAADFLVGRICLHLAEL